MVLWCSAANNTYQFLENGEYSIFIQHADREDALSMECHFAQMNAPPDANIRKFIGTLSAWHQALFVLTGNMESLGNWAHQQEMDTILDVCIDDLIT